MIYQQLINGKVPYVLRLSRIPQVSLHFHVELEISYCMEGEFCISQNGRNFNVREGDIVIIGSNIPHECPTDTSPKILLLEIGPMFLKSHFQSISELSFDNPVFRKGESPFYDEIFPLLSEIISEANKNTAVSDMIISGNLYKLCASILMHNQSRTSAIRKKSTLQIEKALELVYYHYSEDLSIEKAAAVTGYGKSVFCKNFKHFTGMSFHAFLNNYRVSTACYLLLETDMTVDAVASAVGFKDAKSFSRVFKEITSFPPSRYRKNK